MAPIPRLKPYDGPALFSYGFRPFFLFGALYAGFAILVWLPVFHRRARAADRVLAARLARARDALWLRAGGGDGFPADGDSELDRPPAAARHAADHAAPRVDRGPYRGDILRHDRLASRRGDRRRLPAAGRRRRGARDHRRRQLEQPEGRLSRRAACGRQHRLSSRSAFRRRRPNTARASGSPWS